ncbi:hypothetical protein [Lewinella sp. W8]|uniref:hypothetical protein n=1 Tax=Lewinella sp. W8 TaxID=2528208 RepID=UPI0010680C64|nr:hypothetical protein [Lewinella sp. W8]MTB53917.1 hypothetical protein [Lewinella sp. W8]
MTELPSDPGQRSPEYRRHITATATDSQSYQSTEEKELTQSKDQFKLISKILIEKSIGLNKSQRDTSIKIIDQLLRLTRKSTFTLGFSEDEVMFHRKVQDGNLYLLIDEYGGIALNYVGRPGKGSSAQYFDEEEVDPRKINQVANQFVRRS